jgi:hypothetical protein
MRYFKYVVLFGLLLFVFSAHARVRVVVGIGGPVYAAAFPAVASMVETASTLVADSAAAGAASTAVEDPTAAIADINRG